MIVDHREQQLELINMTCEVNIVEDGRYATVARLQFRRALTEGQGCQQWLGRIVCINNRVGHDDSYSECK
ncbi:hypothetical protein D3C84_803420 [compost metagenome]